VTYCATVEEKGDLAGEGENENRLEQKHGLVYALGELCTTESSKKKKNDNDSAVSTGETKHASFAHEKKRNR